MRQYLLTCLARIERCAFGALAGDEIRQSAILRAIAWLLLGGWYLEFSTWWRYSDFTTNAVEAGRHLCWPFFQSCGEWYFLSHFPHANTHGAVYVALFALLIAAAYALWNGQYGRALAIFTVFFMWELLVMTMSMRLAMNFWYFHLIYAALFLFARNKIAVMQVAAVGLYLFSGFLKLDEGWVQGAYFFALEEKLYGIPDVLIPVATNAVIALEIAGSLLLLSARRSVRYAALALFALFHAYSVMYVGYIYPTVALGMVLLLFYPREAMQPLRAVVTSVRRSGAGIAVLGILAAVHAIPYLIEGPSKITHEGNKYGMYMFEANYQCTSRVWITWPGGREEERESVSTYANHRCDPYAHWFYFNQLCTRSGGAERIAWTYDVSVNGGEFQRIVDELDACTLVYSPVRHNDWIRIPGQDVVESVGKPVENRYPTMHPLWAPIETYE